MHASGLTTKRSMYTGSEFADNEVAARHWSWDAMALIPKNEGIECHG